MHNHWEHQLIRVKHRALDSLSAWTEWGENERKKIGNPRSLYLFLPFTSHKWNQYTDTEQNDIPFISAIFPIPASLLSLKSYWQCQHHASNGHGCWAWEHNDRVAIFCLWVSSLPSKMILCLDAAPAWKRKHQHTPSHRVKEATGIEFKTFLLTWPPEWNIFYKQPSIKWLKSSDFLSSLHWTSLLSLLIMI